MDRKSLFLGMTIGTTIGVFAFVLFALGFASNPSEISEISNIERSSGITFNPLYYVTQTRNGEVIYEAYVGNLITNNGLNLVRDKFISSDGATTGTNPANVTFMAVSNDTVAPAITDTNLSAGFNTEGHGAEFKTCGLSRIAGIPTKGQNAGSDDPGNWSVSYKWTATCDNIKVWKFGVFNGTAAFVSATNLGDVAFSIGNFTANVSMETSDELTINVTYIVS